MGREFAVFVFGIVLFAAGLVSAAPEALIDLDARGGANYEVCMPIGWCSTCINQGGSSVYCTKPGIRICECQDSFNWGDTCTPHLEACDTKMVCPGSGCVAPCSPHADPCQIPDCTGSTPACPQSAGQ